VLNVGPCGAAAAANWLISTHKFVGPGRIPLRGSESTEIMSCRVFGQAMYRHVTIIITIISRLTACYNYKDRLIVLLIIKYTRIAAFGLYRS
jgi:hypothetical protein